MEEDKIVVNIHSSQRYSGTPNDFSINLGNSLPKVKSLSCLSAEISNTFYNVHSQVNTLDWQILSSNGDPFIKITNTTNVFKMTVGYLYAPTATVAMSSAEWVNHYNSLSAVQIDTILQLNYDTNYLTITYDLGGATNALIPRSTFMSTLQTYLNTALTTLNPAKTNWFTVSWDSNSRQFVISARDSSGNLRIGYIVRNWSDATSSMGAAVLNIATTVFNGLSLPMGSNYPHNLRYTTTITPQQYTTTTLPVALQAALNVSVAADTMANTLFGANPIVISYSATTYKFTLQINYQGTLNTAYVFKCHIDTSTMDDILGIESSDSLTNPYTPSSIVSLSGPSCIYIYSNCASTFNISGDGKTNWILQKIQVDKPFTQTIFYKSYSSTLERFNISSMADLSQMTFSLRDYAGRLLDNLNSEWTISLMAYF